MKISVIVPIYNAEKYLSKCLESLLGQTHKNLEIILIDDGSTDNSKTICRQYEEKDDRIRFFSQKNQGVSAARNKGLDIATGDFIGFADADDVLQPTLYEVLVDLIEEYESDMSICGYSVVYPGEIRKSDSTDRLHCLSFQELMEEIFTGSIKGFLWNKLFRRDLFYQTRLPDDLHYGDDLYVIAEILSKHKDIKAVYTSESLYDYIQVSNSISNDISRSFNSEGRLKLETSIERIKGLYENDQKSLDLINVSLAQSTLDVFRSALMHKYDQGDTREQYAYIREKLFLYSKYYMRGKNVRVKHKILYILALLSPRLTRVVHLNRTKRII